MPLRRAVAANRCRGGGRQLALAEGDAVVVLREKSGWAKARHARTGAEGWVRTASLREADAAGELTVVALRAVDSDDPRVLCFPAGARLAMLERASPSWIFARRGDGARGYVKVKHVAREGSRLHREHQRGRQAVALRAFRARGPRQLTFPKGEQLVVLRQKSEAWVVALLRGGQRGYAPAKYLSAPSDAGSSDAGSSSSSDSESADVMQIRVRRTPDAPDARRRRRRSEEARRREEDEEERRRRRHAKEEAEEERRRAKRAKDAEAERRRKRRAEEAEQERRRRRRAARAAEEAEERRRRAEEAAEAEEAERARERRRRAAQEAEEERRRRRREAEEAEERRRRAEEAERRAEEEARRRNAAEDGRRRRKKKPEADPPAREAEEPSPSRRKKPKADPPAREAEEPSPSRRKKHKKPKAAPPSRPEPEPQPQPQPEPQPEPEPEPTPQPQPQSPANRARAIATLQSAMRVAVALRRYERRWEELCAQENVFAACRGTRQGKTGWYCRGDGPRTLFEVVDGDWDMVAVIEHDEHRRLVQAARRARDGWVPCPETEPGRPGLYMNSRLQVERRLWGSERL